MVFAKIKDGVCINTMIFSTKEKALEFDNELVEVEEGFGIGDWYKDNQWLNPIPTTEEKIEDIKNELVKLDITINRATEDLYFLMNITPYTTVQQVIAQKENLRIELQKLTEQLEQELIKVGE